MRPVRIVCAALVLIRFGAYFGTVPAAGAGATARVQTCLCQ